jgi:hypothetical protein
MGDHAMETRSVHRVPPEEVPPPSLTPEKIAEIKREAIREFLHARGIAGGKKGGKSRSKQKIEQAKKNLVRARATRLLKKRSTRKGAK